MIIFMAILLFLFIGWFSKHLRLHLGGVREHFMLRRMDQHNACDGAELWSSSDTWS
jgi:hypothetical protein